VNPFWKPLEAHTADSWMRRWFGERIYGKIWRPLLVGKFGEEYYRLVNMAWFWARMHSRSQSLLSYEGGIQALSDQLAERLAGMGVVFRYSTPVGLIAPQADGRVRVATAGSGEVFDRCLATVSPRQLARMTPTLPPAYLSGLLSLRHMGAVVMILALRHQLAESGVYWHNLPKEAGFPFLALVEHTNFLPRERFGGDHIIYCGDYLPEEHEYFRLPKKDLLARFIPALKRFNPRFDPDWVRESWLFKSAYAQPVPLVNHSRNIPNVRTPLQGLFYAGMSQVYPWDRGMNYAVRLARQTVRKMM
jgi:protoporphyrinogen oxidase